MGETVQTCGFSPETPRTCKEREERGAGLRGGDLGGLGERQGWGSRAKGPGNGWVEGFQRR